MSASQTAVISRTHSSSIYNHGYFAERGALYFLQGIAAMLLLPLEILQYLRWGKQVDRTTRFSWILSLVVLLAVGGTLLFSLNSQAQGVDHGGILSACCAVAVVAAIGNGRLQMSIKHDGFEVRSEWRTEQGYGDHGRHGGHRAGHGWMVHPGGRGAGRPAFAEHEAAAAREQQRGVSPWREAMGPVAATSRQREAAASQPSAPISGACIRNCKACNGPVCARTGATHTRRSIG